MLIARLHQDAGPNGNTHEIKKGPLFIKQMTGFIIEACLKRVCFNPLPFPGTDFQDWHQAQAKVALNKAPKLR